MGLEAAPILDAIDSTLRGRIGETRTVPHGVMAPGVFDGQGGGARAALGLSYRHRFEVEFLHFEDMGATPLGSSLSPYRLVQLDLAVRIVTRTQTVVQEDLRAALRASLLQDADIAVQALGYGRGSGNLATDSKGNATQIVNGLMQGPAGLRTPTWTADVYDWESKELRSRIEGSLIVRVSQDTN